MRNCSKIGLALCLGVMASVASAAPVTGSLRSGGQYEARLMAAAVPLSGGMVYRHEGDGYAVKAVKRAPVMGSMRSSGQYEAQLRNSGVPLANGMAWAAHRS